MVKRENDKDHARYLNLLSLNRPHQDTLDVVEARADGWMMDPSTFWVRPELFNKQIPGPPSHLNSQAQVVGHYMQARCDSA